MQRKLQIGGNRPGGAGEAAALVAERSRGILDRVT
jgi:hypothetical protein